MRELKPCGTTAACRRHLRWGQEPCESCKEAEYARNRKHGPFRAARCGTNGGYKRHLRLREKPCESCRLAHSAEAEIARNRRAARTDEIPHGLGGYDNWNCRCPVCSSAKSASNRVIQQRRQRREGAS